MYKCVSFVIMALWQSIIVFFHYNRLGFPSHLISSTDNFKDIVFFFPKQQQQKKTLENYCKLCETVWHSYFLISLRVQLTNIKKCVGECFFFNSISFICVIMLLRSYLQLYACIQGKVSCKLCEQMFFF